MRALFYVRFFTIVAIHCFTLNTAAQTARYFEFSVQCGHGNWQDLSFIAMTTDPVLIDSVLNNISRPLNQRKFISGNIGPGNGGHNYNANHSFKWHFLPNQWNLVDFAVEICDGCPYTDLDSDTAYWFGNVGYFCPWSSKPMREVLAPVNSGEIEPIYVSLFPNPTERIMSIELPFKSKGNVRITNSVGALMVESSLSEKLSTIDVGNLPSGVYYLQLALKDNLLSKKFIIQRP